MCPKKSINIPTVVFLKILASIFLLLVQTNMATADKHDQANAGKVIDAVPYLANPPQQHHPIKVKVAFDLLDLANVDDSDSTFAFTGVLKLSWTDPRNSFDPNVVGVEEKIFSGDFQFNEIATIWYPQVILRNESEHYEVNAILAKIKPNGAITVLRSINATAKTHMDLTYYPFDSQKLKLKFGVFGYDTDHIVLEAQDIHVPTGGLTDTAEEYFLTGYTYSSITTNANILGYGKSSSTFVVDIDVSRKPGFVIRTVIGPLLLIALLTFSIFWFDIKSIQDRVNVSFIGLLTITAYQLVLGDFLPHVAYFTLIQGIVIISLAGISISMIISMYMNHAIDAKPKLVKLNRACRVLFPVSYIISLFAMYAFLSPLGVAE